MKMAMTLTLDGLLQALRGTAHTLAEAAEGRYAETGADVIRKRSRDTPGRAGTQTGVPDDSRHD